MDRKREDDEPSWVRLTEYPVMPIPSLVESDKRCSTRKVVRSNCSTEEVEPGKFLRKCEKTDEILRDCIGRVPYVLESKTERTVEEVPDEEMTDEFLRTFRGHWHKRELHRFA